MGEGEEGQVPGAGWRGVNLGSISSRVFHGSELRGVGE